MRLGKLRIAVLAVFFVAGACVPMLHFEKDHAMHYYSNEWYGKGYFAGLIQFGSEGTYYVPIGIVVGRKFDTFPWFEVYSVKKTRPLDKLYAVYKRYGSKALFVKFKGELRKGGGVKGDQYSIGYAILEEITYFQALEDDQYTALLKYKGEITEADKRMPERILQEIGVPTTNRSKSE